MPQENYAAKQQAAGPVPDACDGQGPHESQRACRTDRLQCGTDCELGARARAACTPDRAGTSYVMRSTPKPECGRCWERRLH